MIAAEEHLVADKLIRELANHHNQRRAPRHTARAGARGGGGGKRAKRRGRGAEGEVANVKEANVKEARAKKDVRESATANRYSPASSSRRRGVRAAR
jgi:hypothetical protein